MSGRPTGRTGGKREEKTLEENLLWYTIALLGVGGEC
jgi:hypothetical protein